jgi:hypothetical protein
MSSDDDSDVDGVLALATLLTLDFFVAILLARGAFMFGMFWLALNSPMA